ncbi:hypothetical protein ACSVH2_11895 [Flavobacterium sp. RSB2_4_14]|uniref:hypothetical protein n=1 Tax=Flavobacterium sp. RSB2_4_14 TaxID=3447665 RepID=UPI003F2AAB61
MKKILLCLVLFVSFAAFSQSINDYQYVIVPIKFDIFKENDKYNLNTTTKLLLQKYNFKAYLSTDDIPTEVINNQCSYLTATLVEKNTTFMTKVKLVLMDCKQKVLFETEFGTSRNKQLAPAYNEALRMASKSFDKLNYKYNGSIISTVTTVVPVATPVPTPTDNVSPNDNKNSEIFYFAQPIANGFQVVDSEPKVIMKLYTTSQKNVFIGIKGTINGVVLSKENQWVFEYYENGKLVSEAINLKF